MAEPVTLTEAKDHLRVVVADDDDMIGRLITAARMAVEQRTQRALVPRTETLAMDIWPDAMRLPWPPLAAVTGITYTDPTGAAQTLAPAAYRINNFTEPARITRANQATWPEVLAQEAGIVVTYTAGYTTPADVPAPLKQWMLLAIGAMYDNREQIAVMPKTAFVEIPESFMSLLWQPYMVYM